MTEGLNWGLPIILYLFLAGMGAGAVTVSASMLLRGGGGGRGVHHEIARYGAFLGPLPVMIGCGLLILELSSFEAGHWFRFLDGHIRHRRGRHGCRYRRQRSLNYNPRGCRIRRCHAAAWRHGWR